MTRDRPCASSAPSPRCSTPERSAVARPRVASFATPPILAAGTPPIAPTATGPAPADLVVALLAVDPVGLGGVVLRRSALGASASVVTTLGAALDAARDGAPRPAATDAQIDPHVGAAVTRRVARRVPLGVTADRLVGGLDLAATLATSRPVLERGLLADADGGVLVLPSAERVASHVISSLLAALDDGEVVVERDGLSRRSPARLTVVAIDESRGDDRPMSAAIADRLAFVLEAPTGAIAEPGAAAVRAARARLAGVRASDEDLHVLCRAADALGVASPRATILALRAARAHAALAGRATLDAADLACAARTVLAPRATRRPPSDADEPAGDTEPGEDEIESREGESPPPPPEAGAPPADHDAAGDVSRDDAAPVDRPRRDVRLEDLVLAAAAAALPASLLAQLGAEAAPVRSKEDGRAGGLRPDARRGRVVGVRPGDPRAGDRLHLLETLRAAAPWQRLRRAESERRTHGASRDLVARGAVERPRPRVAVRRADFRVRRFAERAGSTTIVVVDASGSAALQRLNEAKGAVELLLAESYARRDTVCLLAFRGAGVEELLPPTRALARAKRALAALPGGGGTPLAAAIDAAARAADAAVRRGSVPTVVFLTDGRANLARDGRGGRVGAEADALVAARAYRATGTATLFIDTSPRGEAVARRVAEALGARYLTLPSADASAVRRVVQAATARD